MQTTPIILVLSALFAPACRMCKVDVTNFQNKSLVLYTCKTESLSETGTRISCWIPLRGLIPSIIPLYLIRLVEVRKLTSGLQRGNTSVNIPPNVFADFSWMKATTTKANSHFISFLKSPITAENVQSLVIENRNTRESYLWTEKVKSACVRLTFRIQD